MYQVVNNQFTRILQKIQPSIYGDHLIRPIDRNLVDSKSNKPIDDEPKEIEKVEESKEQSSIMPKVLSGWQLKIGGKPTETPAVVKPKWLSTNTTALKTQIMERTNQLTALIMESQNEKSRIKRIEDLSEHLLSFPEAKHQAIKVCYYL